MLTCRVGRSGGWQPSRMTQPAPVLRQGGELRLLSRQGWGSRSAWRTGRLIWRAPLRLFMRGEMGAALPLCCMLLRQFQLGAERAMGYAGSSIVSSCQSRLVDDGLLHVNRESVNGV